MDPLTLAQAGPIAILLAALGFLWRAFIRGDIVPGALYREAIARAEKAETQAERNADALKALTATVKAAIDGRADART